MQIKFCDKLSKDIDHSDYWLLDHDFELSERRFAPFSVDYFASDRSWLFKPFCTKFGNDASIGII